MTILGILVGAAAVTSGIILAKRSGRKIWHVFTVIGALIITVSLFLMICTLLLLESKQNQQPANSNITEQPADSNLAEQPVGDYWRDRREYSEDYTVGDGIDICFIWSAGDDGQEGWAVYNSNGGGLIQLLIPEGYPVQVLMNELDCLKTEDYDGDGQNELGIVAESGAVIWYNWCNYFFEYLWTESGVSPSQNFRPYEAWAVYELTENQQVLYQTMRDKIMVMEPFSYDAATYGYDILDDVLATWGALKTDEPQIDNYFTVYENISEDGITLSLDSLYYCDWTEDRSSDQTELSKGLKEFDKVLDEIVSGVPENASTYEKYRYLAQELSERADYDYSMSLPAIAAPYGIVTGKMICQGYAEAYQYLCQRAGLWCHTVSGASEGMSHAWNLIWLDGGTYHVDVTWADEQGEPGCPEWMCYFMLTQDEILSDHIILDGIEATGSSLFPPKEQEVEYHINEEDAINLVKRVMDERKESASVFVFTGSEIIEGEHCLTLSAGSYSADGQKYTAMYHYAVSDSGLVYYIDILLGAEWNLYQFAVP